MEVGVFVPEYEKELVWENCGGRDDHKAEQSDPTGDFEIERAQLSALLTAANAGTKMLDSKFASTTKIIASRPARPTSATELLWTREKADEENSDLPLETIENSVGSLTANETDYGLRSSGFCGAPKSITVAP